MLEDPEKVKRVAGQLRLFLNRYSIGFIMRFREKSFQLHSTSMTGMEAL